MLEAGFLVQYAPVAVPVSWTDAFVFSPAYCEEYFFQRGADGDLACAAGFAVLWGDGDAVVRQVDVLPREACDFLWSESRKEHQRHGGQADAVAIGGGAVHQALDLCVCQDVDSLFIDSRFLYFLHRVCGAPAFALRGVEDGAHDGMRF